MHAHHTTPHKFADKYQASANEILCLLVKKSAPKTANIFEWRQLSSANFFPINDSNSDSEIQKKTLASLSIVT